MAPPRRSSAPPVSYHRSRGRFRDPAVTGVVGLGAASGRALAPLLGLPARRELSFLSPSTRPASTARWRLLRLATAAKADVGSPCGHRKRRRHRLLHRRCRRHRRRSDRLAGGPGRSPTEIGPKGSPASGWASGREAEAGPRRGVGRKGEGAYLRGNEGNRCSADLGDAESLVAIAPGADRSPWRRGVPFRFRPSSRTARCWPG